MAAIGRVVTGLLLGVLLAVAAVGLAFLPGVGILGLGAGGLAVASLLALLAAGVALARRDALRVAGVTAGFLGAYTGVALWFQAFFAGWS